MRDISYIYGPRDVIARPISNALLGSLLWFLRHR